MWARCFEMTLELYPNKGQAPLKTLWNENRQAMLQLALAATLGGCAEAAGCASLAGPASPAPPACVCLLAYCVPCYERCAPPHSTAVPHAVPAGFGGKW